MKTRLLMLFAGVIAVCALTASAQMIKRQDAVWARVTSSPITLDGMLTEPDWAVAESINVHWGQSSGMPGSGWHNENAKGNLPTDPTDATIKFLAQGESLYVAIICRDKSIGAGLFNLFDGFLMNVHYRQADGFQGTPYKSYRTNQACEIFYAWCSETWADTSTAFLGAKPAFLGDWPSPYIPRPDSLKLYWDAVTSVQGTTNDDTTPDTAWTTEFKINTTRFGYDIAGPNGDVVQWNVSIYDADWQWPWSDSAKQSNNRTWAQGPWSNASNYGHVSVFVSPTVTTTSGAAPTIGPDLTIPGSNYPSPPMDGTLNDKVWKDPNIGTLQIQYNNTSLRDAYPNTAKWRSGQVQTQVNGSNTQAVVDPNLVTVKYFYIADTLFLGFDVQDRVVQAYTPKMDPANWQSRADGIRVTINDRVALDAGDNVLLRRVCTFLVDSGGTVYRAEDLAQKSGSWDSSGQAVQVAMAMRGETAWDTLGRATPDSGYTAVMKIDLTKLGYPHGRGDGVVFLGIDEFDGDSFTDPTRSYGTQTWFMRQNSFDDGAAWLYMDPTVILGVDRTGTGTPTRFALLGNYPNPFNPSTTIKFQMAKPGEVTLEVFNVLGQRVASRTLGVRQPGENTVVFDASTLASGSYFYRLRSMADNATASGKMILLK